MECYSIPMPTIVDDIDSRIAANIRRRREESGLSQAQLAARSGVSKAMIAKIESRTSSPTAGLLGRLCGGLGVTLSTLMIESEQSGVSCWKAGDQPTWHDRSTGLTRTLVAPAVERSTIEVAQLELPAGTVIAYDVPPPRGLRQHFLMLSGRLAYTIGNDQTLLEPGDALFTLVDRPTRFEVLGDQPARYFVIQEPA